MTLKERVAQLKQRYPNKKLSATTLSRLYKKHKIRKKKIKITKIPNRKQRAKIKLSVANIKKELLYYTKKGFRIIYIDETMITKSTIARNEWSVNRENYEMDMADLNREGIAICAGVSLEYGIDLVMTFRTSIDIPKFRTYLDLLR